MNIAPILISLNLCVFVAAVMLTSQAVRFLHRREIRWLVLLNFSFCVVSFCSVMVFANNDFETMIFFSRLRFLGFAILAPAWLMFFTTGFGRWKFLSKPLVTLLLFVPGAVTLTMALIPALSVWLVRDYVPFEWQNVSVVSFKGGPWFPFHFFISVVLTLLGFTFGFQMYRDTEDRAKRRQILLLMAGGIAGISVDIYCVATNSPLRWLMLSSSCYLIPEGAIFYAVIKQGLFNISTPARERIYRSIPDPMLIIDEMGCLRDLNSAAENLFELDRNAIGRAWNELRPNLDLNQLCRMGNYQKVNDRGELRFFDVMTESLERPSTAGELLIFFREITVQKAIEQDLNSTLEFKARVLSMITHDFSGYLQTQLNLSHILEKNVHSDLRHRAEALTDSVFASKDFMSTVLNWIKTQENRFRPLQRPLELNILIQTVVDSLKLTLETHNLELAFSPRSNSIILNGDALMIESIVRNTLTNAIRASKPGQIIQVDVKTNKSFVEILVQDQGVGMTAEQIEAIARGTISSANASLGGGFGMGLAIVRHFLDLHGGNIQIESQPHQGTVVTLSLPHQEPSC